MSDERTTPRYAGEDSQGDDELAAAAREYLEALESGRELPRKDMIARHPQIAGQLAECLDVLDLVYRTMQAARPAPGAETIEENLRPLGDFSIVRELGRGGMGIVYEAVQLSLNRRVALKVLPFVAALDPVRLQRFKHEAHAAAQLHHTNIVPVYAVGVDRGVHYYAMQLIAGHSLAALVEELRRVKADEPSSAASAAARSTALSPNGEAPWEYFGTVARLMRQIALALEHAHRFGVIHRDVKPGNLMLDETGHIWITDFGLAQFQGDVHLTRSGDLPGTLRYMSPEQVGGDRVILDHRTDVYALGATLYELLTLEPLVAGDERTTLMRRIVENEPRRPRAIDPRIPVELETIVLKAVAKAPADRYQSAQALADDLERWLDDRPILARRPTWRERAGRWRRRHRAVVRSAVVILFLAMLGSLASTIIVGRAYQREQEQRAAAEASFRLAREAVDRFTQLTEQELASKPALHPLRRKFLQTSLDYYESFLEQRQGDPSIQQELAATSRRVSQLVDDLALLESYRPILLLADAHVQQELALTSAQRSETDSILKTLLAAGRQRGEPSGAGLPGLDEQQIAATLRIHQEQIASVLSTSQWRRLQQISRQTQGPFAFKSPEIEDVLALRPEQRGQIQEIIEANGPHTRRPGPKPKGGPPPDEEDRPRGDRGRRGLPPRGEARFDGRPPRPPHEHDRGGPFGPGPMRNVMDETVEQIMTVLTPQQQAQWSELVGERFPYDLRLGPDDWLPR